MRRSSKVTDKKSKRILILEDSRMINNLLYSEFIEDSHEVHQAFNIAEAKELLQKHDFDVITLDLHLPDGNGQEIIHLANEKYPETKIIILTSSSRSSDSLHALGILDYFVKDSTIKHSISKIKNLIEQIDYNKEHNILIVDDSITIRTHLKLLLGSRNFNIFEAPDGKGALELFKNNSIHLVLLDMELPDVHGLKVLAKMKSGDKHNVPIIALSGSNDPDVIRETYKLGASEYVHKPFVPEELIIKIDHWIDRYYTDLKLQTSMQFMKEYQETIDENDIVSKTDTRGIITFVNKEFCDISGYSEDELLWKSHNIVRHPDMDAHIFEDMWKTIKSKKTWKGIIKNRKKDGSHYYVDATIRPIIDQEGNIIEYIGIRHDVTEIQDIKERLSKELNITSQNFQEAYQLSKEYEKAIEESTILSRTDTSGRITYVNKAFELSTGYSKDEIVGNHHRLFRHPDTSAETVKEIWQTISAGKIWRGLIKNKKKDGNPYWVNSVILPIVDSSGNIMEYMSIRNDVSEIMELHVEIENTQKELIYRMGEVAESRSKETGNHIKRVASYSKLLAQKAGLDNEECELLFMASPMHDIGKLSIPDAILQKPGKLDEEEWEIMRSHSQVGYELLQSSDKPILQASAIVAHQHHEKWNGSGYPLGLKGEEIHIYGRITAIADVFDALGSDRCYKKAWELEKIVSLFQEERGEHFDPDLIELFLKNLDEFTVIRDKYKD